jgi:hypothetical protein
MKFLLDALDMYLGADFLMDRIAGSVDRGDLFGPELHSGLIGSRRSQTEEQQKNG